MHISFVAQDDGADAERELDGQQVPTINANLTKGVDLTRAGRLPANRGLAFMGTMTIGPFDVGDEVAREWLRLPNPHGRPNADVLTRWANGDDVTGRARNRWVIDFGDRTEQEAALYEAPFAYALDAIKPFRAKSSMAASPWWKHWRPRPDMRRAVQGLARYVATPLTSKHRVFVWLDRAILPSHALAAIARDDDYTFGVVHSRAHELWALALGTQLETRPRYTPTTCFETFPFPDPTPEQRERVGEAARRLVELRDGWLNPPGLDPADLPKRTLTNLYNQRPTWLANAHADLDAAVFAAYGWPPDVADADLLSHLLALNLQRSGPPGSSGWVEAESE